MTTLEDFIREKIRNRRTLSITVCEIQGQTRFTLYDPRDTSTELHFAVEGDAVAAMPFSATQNEAFEFPKRKKRQTSAPEETAFRSIVQDPERHTDGDTNE